MTPARRVTRRPGVLAVLALVAVGVLGVFALPASSARATEELRDVRRRFLADRDTCALVEALLQVPGDTRYAEVDALLAQIACDRRVSPASLEGVGYPALPAVVASLKALDLPGAEAAARRVGRQPAAWGLGVWSMALVEARRGEDEAAIRDLLSLDPVPDADRERAAFSLALFGAAMPVDDRLILGGVGRAALEKAVEQQDYARVESLGRGLASLDRDYGGETLALALRALRRAGNLTRATALASGPEASGVPGARHALRLENALLALRRGDFDTARNVANGIASVLPVPSALIGALKRTTSGEAPWTDAAPAPLIVADRDRVPVVVARLATLLGLPSTPDDVRATALKMELDLGDPAFAERFFEARGCRVEVVAGGSEPAVAASRAHLPFLLYRIALHGPRYREVPELVRGQIPGSGWWLIDPLDLRTLDALPAKLPLKARLLIAVPPGRTCPIEASVTPPEAAVGHVLAAGMSRLAQGDLEGALGVVEAQSDAFGNSVVYQLYRAFLRFLRFGSGHDPVDLQVVGDALERPVRTEPRLSFERFAMGEARLAYSKSQEDVQAAFDQLNEAQSLEADSASLAEARHRIFKDRDPKAALDALQLARALDPLDANVLRQRGVYYEKSGDHLHARQDLTRALDRRPDDRETASLLVDLEITQHHPDVALAIIERLVLKDPDAANDGVIRGEWLVAEAQVVQNAKSVSALARFAKSRFPETRQRLAWALAQFETKEAETLLRGLLEDPDYRVRVNALKQYILRSWLEAAVESDPPLRDGIVALGRSDASEIVRGTVANLLRLLAKPDATRELCRMLLSDANPYPRGEAAAALPSHDCPEARAALVRALEDEDGGVRRKVIEALARLAGTRLGFDPEGTPAERAAAVGRWKAWLEGR